MIALNRLTFILWIIIEENDMTTIEKRITHPIHPGEILHDELVELNISPAELARQIHVPANRIYQLIAGKRDMTADTALRLQQWLGVSAGFWLNLQKQYELDAMVKSFDEEIKPTIHVYVSLTNQPQPGASL